VIEFGKKRKHKRFIEYTRAVASYDALTIDAARIRLIKSSLLLVADGNDVVVEDGERRLHVKHAEVNFKAPSPLAVLLLRQ